MRQRVAFWIRASIGGIGFGLSVLWYCVIRLLPMPMALRRQAFARAMFHLCTPPLGVRTTFVDVERMHLGRPCIYVCNHQSQIDYVILGAIYPGNALVMASQIGDWPVMGWLYRSSGSITLDRDVPVRAAAALRWAERAIQEQGLSIWMFPEGTRGKVAGRLGRLKRGAFRLAALTGAPVVPIVVSPLKPHTDLRGRRLDPHDVVVRVLEPVTPAGSSAADEDALRDEVRRRMTEALERALVRVPAA